MARSKPARTRAAFTLIELLIAILIIGILATLVTLGVSKAMTYAKQVATKPEMGQIEQALGVAAIEMGRVPYIPSYIKLCNDKTKYGTSAADQMSLRILSQMFPNAWTGANGMEDWNGPNMQDPSNGIIELKADRAFVFFLRGPEGNGFSAKGPPTSNPTSGKRYGPYFNFPENRLAFDPTDKLPRYLDYWQNDPTNSNNPAPFLVVYSQMMVGSNASFRPDEFGTAAYNVPPGRQLQKGKLYMPKGYQIFSAGKDGRWGSTGYGVIDFQGNLMVDGEDDQANFSESPLGKPIND
jgi:prepilin-type N-terminal cleavage/methylation domain-containing protein